MANQKPLLSKFLSFLLLSLSLSLWGQPPLVMTKEVIPIGVVLDLKSPVGRVAERYMSMALSDFYAVNHNYSTRLSLLTKDSGNDIIAAASAGEKVVNNWSRFVLIIWIFVVLILTQSYTASLTSMLTIQRLQPTFVDVKEIKKNGYFVGYQKDSSIKVILINQLGFHESKLKPYETPEEYDEALSNGTHNGGVAAIFDEIPYLKLFVAKYCSKYTMVGPIYKFDGGFGFAFQQRSPLVPYISKAIFNVTQDKDKIEVIEKKYFSSQTACEDQSTAISSYSHSLGVDSFRGLFLITGITSMVSLLIYVSNFVYSHWPVSNDNNSTGNSFWSILVEMAKHLDQKDLSSHDFQREESRVHAVVNPNVFDSSPRPRIDEMQSHSRNSIEGIDDVVIHDDNRSLSSSSRHEDASMQDVHNSS